MWSDVRLFQTPGIPCPYLPGRTWKTILFQTETLDGETYERLLSAGFRRSGHQFYQNTCQGCRSCIPLRIAVDRFTPSKSLRRVARRNQDLEVRLEPAGFSQEAFLLYQRYCEVRHDKEGLGEQSFRDFLCSSPLETVMMFYRDREGRLLGVGWVDVLPNGLSSVYFASDPQDSWRSLGTFSALYEIEIARRLGKPWLYLGFWVPGSRKMEYKARFHPHQILTAEGWKDVEGRSQGSGEGLDEV